MAFKRLRLILGDQLNADHSWFQTKDCTTLYLIAELKQETNYVRHHIQKVCAFFAAMRNFADALQSAGHQVAYLTLDESAQFSDLPSLLNFHFEKHNVSVFEYQQPDEHRLSKQLALYCQTLSIETLCVSSQHFFLEYSELPKYLKKSKHNRMESFYRKMRKRFSVLMQGNEPEGGKWNFDANNRNSFKNSDIKDIPKPLLFATDVSKILARLERHEVETFGETSNPITWPTSRKQARDLLSFFCTYCLPKFGQFQDAMTLSSEHAWSLYHSRLGFALNSKMISPHEVIDHAIQHYYNRPQEISISQIEGFIRQILGWREYVRGIYWVNEQDYHNQNSLSARRQLPQWFWTGDTKMRCQQAAITQSLKHAYAHHIQRLMITGNFALLAGINPDAVDEWYLGIYIDAIEWVEMPNTRGMALFADGGWIATKPYAASGNYINKMSDYCSQCTYSIKSKHEELSCPMNSFYWYFIDQHYNRFRNNPRMSFPIKQWEKMNSTTKTLTIQKAEHYLANINQL